jgi:hypothetical protein
LHFSDSFSTEDSDYRMETAEELHAFEAKKRKIDEVEGQSSRHTRQTRKTAAEGGSSAAAGPWMRSKHVYSCGPHPPRKGKGARGPVDVEKEQEIEENLGTANISIWRKLRLANPYRFHERQYTGTDKRFWTDSQHAMWDDYYDASKHMKSGFYVVPKSLNVEHFQQHVSRDFRYINEALLKMDVMDLVTLSESIQPLVVRQFCCTVFFHNDPEESFSWMSGQDVFTATFANFCDALGYGDSRAGGFKIHSEAPFAVEKISRICYPDVPSLPAPAISGMYYYYNALAKLFCQNSVRGYHRNLLYYCQPDKLWKIDGCDFIFQEMKRSTLKRMTPNYCQYVQRLINR